MASKFYGYVNSSTDLGDGILKLASDAETVTGIISDQAVNPSSLKAKLGNQTLNGILYGKGTGAELGATAAGTNGQVLLGSTGSPAAFGNLASAGGTVVFSPGSNSLNLEAAGATVWSVVTGASQAMVKSNGYFANRAGTVAFSLPAVMAVGDSFSISNMAGSATGWTLATGAAAQYIRIGNQTTTVTTGTLASSATGDTIRLVCSIANTEVVVQSSMGNITVT